MKIAMLLSGGVDSSVALALLNEQKHDITAFYLKIWLEDELSFLGTCPWEEDLVYARGVCEQLDVPLEVVSFQKEYHDRVIGYTIDAVKNGLTPNPDMLCNREVKFGAFNEKYGADFDRIATGHYAQVMLKEQAVISRKHVLSNDRIESRKEDKQRVQLKQAPDPVKDQTYFLAMMTQEQLQKALFPIGHLAKKDVRALAQKYHLPTAKRKDSQGLCFLGQISFTDFIKAHCGEQAGDFIEKETGKKIGEHTGHYFYTIGQRRGTDLNGGPWYVCDKDIAKNIVYVSHGFAGEDQRRDTFDVRDMNWLSGEAPAVKELRVKLRHGPEFYNCILNQQATTNNQQATTNEKQPMTNDQQRNKTFRIKLAQKDQGVTPGQFAVFYDGFACLGGGVIV